LQVQQLLLPTVLLLLEQQQLQRSTLMAPADLTPAALPLARCGWRTGAPWCVETLN
jgi:hypothetical protein